MHSMLVELFASRTGNHRFECNVPLEEEMLRVGEMFSFSALFGVLSARSVLKVNRVLHRGDPSSLL
jgi:hypothetical protein